MVLHTHGKCTTPRKNLLALATLSNSGTEAEGGMGVMKFYGIWLGSLAVFEFLISRVGLVERFPLLSLIGTFAYLISFPYFAIRFYRKKYDRFLRCPKCRVWFASDLNGSRLYPPPNPQWEVVVATNCCPKCGTHILLETNVTGG
jgi:hypothetical protein